MSDMAVFPPETEDVPWKPCERPAASQDDSQHRLGTRALEQGSQQVGQPQWPPSHCPFLCNSCHQASSPEAERHLKLQSNRVRHAQPWHWSHVERRIWNVGEVYGPQEFQTFVGQREKSAERRRLSGCCSSPGGELPVAICLAKWWIPKMGAKGKEGIFSPSFLSLRPHISFATHPLCFHGLVWRWPHSPHTISTFIIIWPLYL